MSLICKCGEPLEKDWQVCPVCDTEIEIERKNNCKNCGKTLNPNWKKCPFCTTVVGAEMVCKNCGEELENGMKICPECFQPLEIDNSLNEITDSVIIETIEKEIIKKDYTLGIKSENVNFEIIEVNTDNESKERVYIKNNRLVFKIN